MGGTGRVRTVSSRGPLRGTLRVPGDKSISHRSLIFNGLATGSARITGLLQAGDVQATARAMVSLGCIVEQRGDETVIRPPAGGLSEPIDVLDCGNSGTTMRLLTGVLAAHPFHSVLTGDASLRRRPMMRVVAPLREMGARIRGRQDGRLAPLAIAGGPLENQRHVLSVSSAQVKSCLLLAGMKNGVSVREPRQSRDHTERFLTRMGAPLSCEEGTWVLGPDTRLAPVDVTVPADLSAAAFFLVAGCIVPGSEICLERVGVNPTRAGILDVLARMGADILREPVEDDGPEPMAALRVQACGLIGIEIAGDLALRALDELPVIAVAAAFAHGTTVIRDAEELRVKESDRIARTVAGLRALGVAVEETPDGMVIEGGGGSLPSRTSQATVDATGDHRIAMAFAIAALAGGAGVEIIGADAIESSYPAFFEHVEQLCGS